MKNTRFCFFIILLICFLGKSAFSHAVTIKLCKAPSDWMPEFYVNVPIKVTIKGDLDSRHTVVFNLSNVTNWPGVCINDGSKNDLLPDLVLSANNQETNSGVTWSKPILTSKPIFDSIKAEFTPSASTSKFTFYVTIECFDFAAYGQLNATIYGSDGTNSPPLNSSNTITIPRDENGNKIADNWLYNAATDTDSDDETGPGSNSNNGDGFTIFEEYRGFYIQGEHTRICPLSKDIFIYSNLDEGLGYATNIDGDNPYTFNLYQVSWTDMDGGNRVMNSRQCPGYSYMEQRAIRVLEDKRSKADEVDYAYGRAYPIQYHSSPNIPANMLQAFIYTKSIDHHLEKPEVVGRISKSDAISLIIGHEVGHHVNLADDALGSWNNDDGTANSIMSYTDYLYQKSPNFPPAYHEDEFKLTDGN